ncbi:MULTISPECIES: NAD(P)-dependent alcohol dehydrogenase [Novosphingobium]|uniref:Alcohol dehydrogenase zinc-binding domain protein n=1 Tax=Novosphingobium resinovorum TaxID=158500 RepID=A0A031JE44_9SPHN|nr:NAD(P)-dependent alcohol dehydrogenase [Novosphingobium resinovorum]EZP71513.1 Alcohol dehydrogenase zinc-binding domain protein [Novosphingobium resinovorum]GLK46325.1 aryl-alcohol dehydrogenase [Novosphingobium resinovorum]
MSTPSTERRPITAAVVRKQGGDFVIEQASIGAPGPREVLVRVVATGVCHTDMIIRDQYYPSPLPAVLGHEGSGVVEAVGEDVHAVAPGDHVVMTFMSCGYCVQCDQGHPAHCENFFALNFGGGRDDGTTATCDDHGHELHDHFFGQSSFGSFAIAHERNVVKVPKDAPLELLGPLGCGIMTGAGAVLNALDVKAGTSFAAFGSGAVGLSAVMAAKVAGATTIIAVDVTPSRLELAKELGATHVVNSREVDAVKAIKEITGGGVNFTLESSGRPEVLRQAVDALSIRGTCGIVGAPKLGTEASFDVNDVMVPGKKILGIVEGDSVPQVFIPRLVDLFLQGRFPFDKLVGFYKFDQINEAIADSESGKTIKPILRF